MTDFNSEQYKRITLPILVVLASCILLAIFIAKIQNNSESFLYENYTKIRSLHYSGVISDKLTKENGGRIREVQLNNNSIHEIPFYIYEKLAIGDSIIKLKQSDSVIYITKRGEKIYEDINEFYRNKYLEKINRKQH